MSSLRDDIAAIAQGATRRSAQIRRQMSRIINRHRDAHALFLGDDGRLKPAARRWLDDLAARCLAAQSTFDVDPYAHARNAGRREIWLWVQSGLFLDHDRLDALNRQLEENDDD